MSLFCYWPTSKGCRPLKSWHARLLHHHGSHYYSARRYKGLTSLWQGRQEWGHGRIPLGSRNRQGSWLTCRGRCCPRVALQSRRSAHPRPGTAPLPTWHLRMGRKDCKDADRPLKIAPASVYMYDGSTRQPSTGVFSRLVCQRRLCGRVSRSAIPTHVCIGITSRSSELSVLQPNNACFAKVPCRSDKLLQAVQCC